MAGRGLGALVRAPVSIVTYGWRMPRIPGTAAAPSPRKIAVSVVGAALILVGVAALLLPGPGLLLILVGLIVLASEFEWAARRVDWMRAQALSAAEYEVATVTRIAFSTLSGIAVMGVGVFWGLDPQIPEIWIVGPDLPFGGWGTGAAIVAGGVLALVLLAYSVKRFRVDGDAAPTKDEVRSERSSR
ncbi:hypothetical protein BH20ACT6_BH20ACT6_15230 [soil metagenome]